MQLSDIQHRLGLGGERSDPRLAWAIILITLAMYASAFFVFYPYVITNDDEAVYIEQARVFAGGATSIERIDPRTGESRPYRTVDLGGYPVGTAALMAPLVAALGWKAAFLVPLLALIAGTLIVARWLQDEGRSPLFALLVLGFPASLVMGRVGMSDVPSLTAVALAFWLFWRGLDRGWPHWAASGFVAAASMMLRDTNAVMFAPLYAGALVRRDRNTWALILGGLLGLALKILSSYVVYGDPLYSRSEYIPQPETMIARLAIYLVGLVVFVPGGLVLGMAYRGRRWPEIAATIPLFVLFFIIPLNTTFASGLEKRLILDWRYMLPLVPLLAFAMAESLPRLWDRLIARLDAGSRSRLQAVAAVVLLLWMGSLASASVVVHYAFDRWSASQAAIRDAIDEHTGDETILVTNRHSTRKLIRNLERKYHYLDRAHVTPRELADLLERFGEVYVVFLDRSETPRRREDVARNDAFIAAITPAPTLEFDRQMTATDRLRIWRVVELESGAEFPEFGQRDGP